MRRLLSIGLSLAFLATLALTHQVRAAEPEPKDAGPVDIELPAIFAPMSVNNRLESYAYITVAITPAGRDKVLTIREKVPFLQDAFLRELNKGSIVKAGDAKAVDTVAVKARLTARMALILPAGTASSLKLEQIVMAPVTPGS